MRGLHDSEPERIGRRLRQEGLVSGNFGNMSLRGRGGFYIKRSGAFMDDPWEPVFVPFEGHTPAAASREERVHREIYLRTGHRAVIHAHPPNAIAASFLFEQVIPQDSEGLLLCPWIPVVTGEPGSQELAGAVAEALVTHPIAIARGHGTFAAGRDLLQAFLLTSAAEHSCRILLLLGSR